MNEEIKIIGYKLIKPEYQAAVLAICDIDYLEDLIIPINSKTISILDSLAKAGVLDLWFKVVYTSSFEVGDWVSFYSHISNKIYTSKIKEWTPHAYCILEDGSQPFKHLLRKATDYEIYSVKPNITILHYKLKFSKDNVSFGGVIIDKDVFIKLSLINILNSKNSNIFIRKVDIGEVTFTIDQINIIGEYYKNLERVLTPEQEDKIKERLNERLNEFI